jgi:hypothetical protein
MLRVFSTRPVSTHIIGRRDLAEELIRLADMPVLRDYTDSLWGVRSPYVQYRAIADAPTLWLR